VDWCPDWPAATGTVVVARQADGISLQQHLDDLATGGTLEVEDGTWDLTEPLRLTTEGITLRSESGLRDAVVLDGNQLADSVIEISASGVSVVSLTLTDALNDGIRLSPSGADIANITLYDLVVVDNGQYGIHADAENNIFFVDDTEVACSTVQLTPIGRPLVRNGCRTGGIEALRVRDWTVRDTEVTGFWCDLGDAAAGIRFWRGSRDSQIWRARVGDSRRGIVLGFGDDAIVRTYGDAPCGGTLAQHYGGGVFNSFVWANDIDLIASSGAIEDGIAVESACEVSVLHNSVHSVDPPIAGGIVHRYAPTTGAVVNNLTTNTVRRLDGALTTATSNLENVLNNTFVDSTAGDLHLAPGVTDPSDSASPDYLTVVAEDVDGEARDAMPDYGADERL